MADFYLDHGAYASALGATPTWGVPQEGDGSATTAAAAAGTCSIVFSGVPGSGTISVCGVSVSTTGVIGAASADAAANALASNINATTTAVASTVAIGQPQLRNLVYARGPSGGAAAGTCEIMMRVGSTTLNYSVNTNCALATTLTNVSSSGATHQFSGGSGGCWGWLWNPTAIGVASSIAVGTYGILVAKPLVRTAALTHVDIVWVRSGNNPTITYSGAGVNFVRFITNSDATTTYPLHLIVDTNTKWTGDGAAGVVTINLTISSATGLPGIYGISSNQSVLASVSSLGSLRLGGLVFNLAGTGANVALGTSFSAIGVDQNFELWNVQFNDTSTGSNSVRLTLESQGTGGGSQRVGRLSFTNCTFARLNAIANSLVTNLTVQGSSSVQMSYTFTGCRFVNNVSGASAPVIVDVGAASLGPAYGVDLRFFGCSWTGWGAGGDQFYLHNTITAWNTNPVHIEAIDCTGLVLTSAYAGCAQAMHAPDLEALSITIHSPAGGGPYRYEGMRGIVEWNPAASPVPPTLSAVQPSGTAWSVHARWLATANVVERGAGFELPPFRVAYVDTSANRTITLEALMHSSLLAALGPRDIAVMVSYVSNATSRQVAEMMPRIPVASAASWTNASGYPSHTPVKFSLTTAAAVKQGTEIAIHVTLRGIPRTGVSESVFFDPEPAVV